MIEFDRDHLWHPYTSMAKPLPSYPVARAEGACIELTDGRRLIDGMSSWWCAIHGYNQPHLNAAAEQQLQHMAHVMFGGLTHQPAVDLGRQLVDLTPEPLQKVFLADSGSVAIEVALKMAVQYWFAQGHAEKHKVLALRGAYHGDTLGAMSVCDPVNGMHSLFSEVLPQQIFADQPIARFDETPSEAELKNFTRLFVENHRQLAAVIIEPVVQGAGGMWFYSPAIVQHLRQLCDHYNVLLIADEIATGFGRTGKLFACEHADVVPDILALGKALTGGYMTLAATLTTDKVAQGICANDHVLMHGPTFMGNPLACAVANASLQLLQANDWQRQVAAITNLLKEELLPYSQHAAVKDVRVLGAIGVVELHQPVDLAQLQRRFVEAGVWIRPFGRLVYLMPPYIIEPDQLRQLCRAIALAWL